MLKKFFYGMMAATMLVATSCTDEPMVGGDEATVSFSISTPEIATRAFSDGTTATQLQYAVYDNEGNILPDLTVTDGEINGKTTVSLKLKTGKTYNVVFWADNEDAPYTVDFAAKTMTINYAGVTSNNENYDAFYKAQEITVKGDASINVELRRPFAQLNIGTNDYDAAKDAGYVPTLSAVTVEDVYKTLNLMTGEVTNKLESVTFDYATIPDATKGTFPVTGYQYLAMNYVLVDDEQELVDITFAYKENANSVADERTVGSVPVRRNYRTNLYGSLLTSNQDVNVEIKPGYDGQATLDALQNAALNGGTVELTEDVVLTTPLQVYSTMTIKLNGKTINAEFQEGSTTNHLYAIENHGILTLEGTGTINARGIFNYGTITLNDATINAIDGNGGYGVRNYEGAKLVMNSGIIATTLEDDNNVNNGGYDATPVRVDEGATFEMNGGELKNICDFTFALDNYGKAVINNGKVTSIHSTISTYGDLTINGGEFICNGLEGVTAHTLVAWNGCVTTINGGIFDGKDNYNGFNVDAVAGAKVYIHGGEFKPVHSGSLYGDGTIIVDGGVFFDEVPNNRLADGYAAIENNGVWTVVATANSAETLAAAIENGGVVVLTSEITLSEAIAVSTAATINLNGKEIKSEASDGFVVSNGGELTIRGNGKVTTNGAPIRAIGGKVVVEGGEFTQTGAWNTAVSTYRYGIDSREGGEIIINGGVFKTNNGMINVSPNSSVVIEGGNFVYDNTVGGTRHFAYVSGNLTIKDGEFKGVASSAAGGEFFCGAGADGKVVVEGGKFTSLWTSGSKNKIWSSYASGSSIEVKGGIFNHNGGISAQVIENTDAATKDAYPYMAK